MNESTQPKAKKSLGQHFLRHESICNRIASLLLPKDTDNVIEIGPGPGALTRAIEAQSHARLVLLEKDSHWAAERQRLGAARTQAVLTDALRFDWSRITPDNPWKIIGNLPYNVASPMMWDLFSRATGLVRAAFMVQKEVADRMQEGPGSQDYGALSLAVQCQKITRSFQIRNPIAKKTLHVAFAPCLWMHGNASHISCAEQLTPCCHLLRKHRNLGPESAVFRNSDAVDPCHFRSCLINPWN